MGVSRLGVLPHSFERVSAVPLVDVEAAQLGTLVNRFIVIITAQDKLIVSLVLLQLPPNYAVSGMFLWKQMAMCTWELVSTDPFNSLFSRTYPAFFSTKMLLDSVRRLNCSPIFKYVCKIFRLVVKLTLLNKTALQLM